MAATLTQSKSMFNLDLNLPSVAVSRGHNSDGPPAKPRRRGGGWLLGGGGGGGGGGRRLVVDGGDRGEVGREGQGLSEYLPGRSVVLPPIKGSVDTKRFGAPPTFNNAPPSFTNAPPYFQMMVGSQSCLFHRPQDHGRHARHHYRSRRDATTAHRRHNHMTPLHQLSPANDTSPVNADQSNVPGASLPIRYYHIYNNDTAAPAAEAETHDDVRHNSKRHTTATAMLADHVVMTRRGPSAAPRRLGDVTRRLPRLPEFGEVPVDFGTLEGGAAGLEGDASPRRGWGDRTGWGGGRREGEGERLTWGGREGAGTGKREGGEERLSMKRRAVLPSIEVLGDGGTERTRGGRTAGKDGRERGGIGRGESGKQPGSTDLTESTKIDIDDLTRLDRLHRRHRHRATDTHDTRDAHDTQLTSSSTTMTFIGAPLLTGVSMPLTSSRSLLKSARVRGGEGAKRRMLGDAGGAGGTGNADVKDSLTMPTIVAVLKSEGVASSNINKQMIQIKEDQGGYEQFERQAPGALKSRSTCRLRPDDVTSHSHSKLSINGGLGVALGGHDPTGHTHSYSRLSIHGGVDGGGGAALPEGCTYVPLHYHENCVPEFVLSSARLGDNLNNTPREVHQSLSQILDTAMKREEQTLNSYRDDIERTRWLTKQHIERMNTPPECTPPRILLVASNFPKRQQLLERVTSDSDIIVVTYDFHTATFDSLIAEVRSVVSQRFDGCLHARSTLILCRGGLGHLYMLKRRVLTVQKLNKETEQDAVRFWVDLGEMTSRLDPDHSHIYIFVSEIFEAAEGIVLGTTAPHPGGAGPAGGGGMTRVGGAFGGVGMSVEEQKRKVQREMLQAKEKQKHEQLFEELQKLVHPNLCKIISVDPTTDSGLGILTGFMPAPVDQSTNEAMDTIPPSGEDKKPGAGRGGLFSLHRDRGRYNHLTPLDSGISRGGGKRGEVGGDGENEGVGGGMEEFTEMSIGQETGLTNEVQDSTYNPEGEDYSGGDEEQISDDPINDVIQQVMVYNQSFAFMPSSER